MSSTTSLTARRRHLAPARSERTSLSSPTVVALFATAVVGLAKGAVAYTRRSSVPKAHVRPTNCVTQEICIAVAFFIVIVVVEMRRRQHGLPSPWVAPFTRHAWSRLRAPFTEGGWTKLLRLSLMVPLVVFALYWPYRMGAQIIGGLDHNSTVNAWGAQLRRCNAGALVWVVRLQRRERRERRLSGRCRARQHPTRRLRRDGHLDGN